MPQRTRLAPLQALTTSSLASLRHLKIVLSEASCHHLIDNVVVQGDCCDYVSPRSKRPPRGCKYHEHIPHSGPLQATDPFTQATLDEWRSTTALLASRGVSLDNLELSFVCDVRHDESEIAQLAVAPLASLAPLKDCHVRLCREPIAQIQEVAQDAVLNVRGISRRPHPPLSPHGGYPTRRFAISLFLRDVVPDSCLGLLRFVEVVFPPYRHDSWPRDGHPAMEDWIGCIGYIKHKVNAPALTVRLYMADTSDWDPQEDVRNMSKENGHEVLKAYTRILGPLAELGSVGLARFYAHFVCPWTWTEEVQDRLREQEGGQRWLTDKEGILKERAERWVMAERYGTLHEDGEEPPESLWKHSFGRDC